MFPARSLRLYRQLLRDTAERLVGIERDVYGPVVPNTFS